MVEYLHGKQKVAGSIPVKGFFYTYEDALVAKLVNAVVRGAIVNDLWVQIPSRALLRNIILYNYIYIDKNKYLSLLFINSSTGVVVAL